jgi:hypothetical protein
LPKKPDLKIFGNRQKISAVVYGSIETSNVDRAHYANSCIWHTIPNIITTRSKEYEILLLGVNRILQREEGPGAWARLERFLAVTDEGGNY